MTRRLLVPALLVTLLTTAAHAESDMFYMGGELHHWTESSGGQQLLVEDGLLMAMGLISTMRPERRWDLQAEASLFFGGLHYNGQNFAGDPVQSESSYFGARAELDLHGALLRGPGSALRFYTGIGNSNWWRTLASQPMAEGYTENWSELHLRVGLSAVKKLGGRSRLQAELGLETPIFASNEVDLSRFGAGRITVHPEGKLGLFAAVNLVQKGDLSLGLAYQAMRFAQSEVQGGLAQPDSTSDTLSFRVGGAW